MLLFREFLNQIDEAATQINKHSTHLEDLIFFRKADGARAALDALRDIAENIGTAKAVGMLNTKLDGSPSAICGFNKGKFFVATKGAFSKIPKLAYTDADIKVLYPSYLYDVLSSCLTYLPKVIPSGRIFQMDILATKSTLKSATIAGKKQWVMHPNTIMYTAEQDSDIGRQIGRAKLMVGVHTEYTIDADDVLSVKGFGVSEKTFRKSPDVFLMDANHKTIGSMDRFSGSEASRFWSLWKAASSLKPKFNFDESYHILLTAFVNSYIREGRAYPSPEIMVSEFKGYCQDKFTREASKLKTQKSIDAKQSASASVSSYIDSNIRDFTDVFHLFKLIQVMKDIIIRKLDSVKEIGTFIMKSDGSYEVSGAEGFVLSQGDVAGVKLVSRRQFSSANFSKDVIKGFERP